MTTPEPALVAGTIRSRHREPFGGHVAGQVAALQHDLLRLRSRSSAVALAARLRGAATRAPGYDYAVLDVTRVPERLLGRQFGEQPTDSEWAKHAALTLYALHQQSVQDAPMHRDGQSLGAAVGQLSRAEAVSADAVRRRFTALGTATTYDAALYHLRGLVGQLRQHRIALDYGLLADDLLKLQRPGGPERVRALWGRDFYRSTTDDNDQSEPASTDIQE